MTQIDVRHAEVSFGGVDHIGLYLEAVERRVVVRKIPDDGERTSDEFRMDGGICELVLRTWKDRP